jgi:hypothetical protein
VDGRRRVTAPACLLVVAVVAVVASTVVVLIPRPAGALSCASHPRGTPSDILSGHPVLAGGSDFFRRFDRAVIGTVTEISTVEDEVPEYADTTITVDVAAVVGDTAVAPSSIEVSSPDPGWNSGHPYEVGTTYFIPLQTVGPDGRPDASAFCDPISEVRLEEVEELGRLAAEAGIAFSTPAPDSSSRAVIVVVAAAVIVALLGGLVLARRLVRRRSADPRSTSVDT